MERMDFMRSAAMEAACSGGISFTTHPNYTYDEIHNPDTQRWNKKNCKYREVITNPVHISRFGYRQYYVQSSVDVDRTHTHTFYCAALSLTLFELAML